MFFTAGRARWGSSARGRDIAARACPAAQPRAAPKEQQFLGTQRLGFGATAAEFVS